MFRSWCVSSPEGNAGGRLRFQFVSFRTLSARLSSVEESCLHSSEANCLRYVALSREILMSQRSRLARLGMICLERRNFTSVLVLPPSTPERRSCMDRLPAQEQEILKAWAAA